MTKHTISISVSDQFWWNVSGWLFAITVLVNITFLLLNGTTVKALTLATLWIYSLRIVKRGWREATI